MCMPSMGNQDELWTGGVDDAESLDGLNVQATFFHLYIYTVNSSAPASVYGWRGIRKENQEATYVSRQEEVIKTVT